MLPEVSSEAIFILRNLLEVNPDNRWTAFQSIDALNKLLGEDSIDFLFQPALNMIDTHVSIDENATPSTNKHRENSKASSQSETSSNISYQSEQLLNNIVRKSSIRKSTLRFLPKKKKDRKNALSTENSSRIESKDASSTTAIPQSSENRIVGATIDSVQENVTECDDHYCKHRRCSAACKESLFCDLEYVEYMCDLVIGESDSIGPAADKIRSKLERRRQENQSITTHSSRHQINMNLTSKEFLDAESLGFILVTEIIREMLLVENQNH